MGDTDPDNGDPMAWTAARLLALAGQRGQADGVVAAVLTPATTWQAPWTMAGHPARTAHRPDWWVMTVPRGRTRK